MFEFESRHFSLEQVREGIWAAVAKPSGLAVSNAGLIDLGDRALMVDTFMSPHAARDLVMMAERLMGHAPAVAVNTHRHADHVFGNAVLPPETSLISTALTRAALDHSLAHAIEQHKRQLPREIDTLEQQLATTYTPVERAQWAEKLRLSRLRLQDLSGLTPRLPNIVFEGRMVLHGSARRAELLTFGGGHTDSDALVWLPEDGVIFMGDLLFYRLHAWLGDGHPVEWLRILDEIEAHDPTCQTYVPGHGPLAPRASLEEQRAYLRAALHAVDEARAHELTAEEVSVLTPPEAYASWAGAERWANNVWALCVKCRE